MIGYLKDSLRRERMKREAFELEMRSVIARVEVVEAQMLIVKLRYVLAFVFYCAVYSCLTDINLFYSCKSISVSRRFVRKTFCQDDISSASWLRRFVRKTFCQAIFLRRFVRKTFRQGISLQHFFQVACLGRFVRKTNCQDRWDYKIILMLYWGQISIFWGQISIFWGQISIFEDK